MEVLKWPTLWWRVYACSGLTGILTPLRQVLESVRGTDMETTYRALVASALRFPLMLLHVSFCREVQQQWHHYEAENA